MVSNSSAVMIQYELPYFHAHINPNKNYEHLEIPKMFRLQHLRNDRTPSAHLTPNGTRQVIWVWAILRKRTEMYWVQFSIAINDGKLILDLIFKYECQIMNFTVTRFDKKR